MEKQKILKKFKDNLMEFIDQLREQYPNIKDLKLMKIYIKASVPMTEVIDNFYRYSIPHKNKISTKDENFFLQNDNIFSFLAPDKQTLLKDIWNQADNDTKDIIWQWFNLLINLSEQYYN
jgi:hypothetical protein